MDNEITAILPQPPRGSIGIVGDSDQVWLAHAGHGKVSRLDPITGETVAVFELTRYGETHGIDMDENGVWVAHGLENGHWLNRQRAEAGLSEVYSALSLIDPEANRVVWIVPFGFISDVVAGYGSVWAAGADVIYRVDPDR